MLVVVLALFGGQLARRVLTTETLGLRADVWSSSLASWVAHPLFGTGPATFAFLLQPTGYFDAATYVPKHADSLYIQTLAELGLLPVVALLGLATAVGRAWISSLPRPVVVWPLAFAAVVGLASNPVIPGFGAVLVAFWCGMSVPLPQSASDGGRSRRQWPFVAAGLVLVVAGGPAVLVTLAAIQQDTARSRAAAGDMPAALTAVEHAIQLDPTFPLYRRERGALLLVEGHAEAAYEELQVAVRENPYDDSIWRALALAALAADDPQEAMDAARSAVELQRTESLNLATLAFVANATGDESTRDGALQLMVTLSPWTPADPAWVDAFPTVNPPLIVAAAEARASASAPLAGTDTRWLEAFSGSVGDRPSGAYTAAQVALTELMGCRVEQAVADLARAQRTNATDREFWLARWVADRLAGIHDDTSLDVLVMLSSPVREEGSPLSAPLVDEAAYGRLPIAVTEGVKLPSPDDGVSAWIIDPAGSLAVMRGSKACA